MATILIIDNDQLIRKLLTKRLHDAGWTVLSYGYDEINLSLLKQIQPDLIILSFTNRKGGAGWQFLHLLKTDDATAHILILITTTSFPLAPEMQGYLLIRYIQVTYQPFDLDTFIQLVRRTLTLARHMDVLIAGDRPLPILVVEDTEILRQELEMVLLMEGHHVVTANDGQLALEAVYRSDHSFIFLDIRMPIMDGFEFLSFYEQQLRPHSAVIILSAEMGLESRVFPSFVVDVISKPYEIKHLVSLVGKYTQVV